MGQAKHRGSLEARVETAIKAKDHRIEALRETLAIPERIKFCGYLVKVDETDEFLATIHNGIYGYVGNPETALRLNDFDEAWKLARDEHGEVVVALFDFGAKLVVANMPQEPANEVPAAV